MTTHKTPREGRKIPWAMENPIDNIVVGAGEPIQPTLYKMGITPNMITTVGVILRCMALYHLFRGETKFFFIEAVLSYFMDCLDGNYARRYHMCTKFGDYYDHLSDLVFHGILLYYLVFHSKMTKSKNWYNWIIVILILMYLMCWHFGCQEDHYHEENGGSESKSLNIFQQISLGQKHWIYFTRYFGCGTFALLVYLLLFFYK